MYIYVMCVDIKKENLTFVHFFKNRFIDFPFLCFVGGSESAETLKQACSILLKTIIQGYI